MNFPGDLEKINCKALHLKPTCSEFLFEFVPCVYNYKWAIVCLLKINVSYWISFKFLGLKLHSE